MELKVELVLRENARLQDELEAARTALEAAREENGEAAEVAAARAREMGREEGREKCRRLECRLEEVCKELEETKEANVSLKSEIERMNGDLSMKEEMLREARLGSCAGNEVDLSHDLLDLSASGDYLWNNLNNSYFKGSAKKDSAGGPKAASTPFIRNLRQAISQREIQKLQWTFILGNFSLVKNFFLANFLKCIF